MSEKMPHIPEEVYLGFLGRTVEIHCENHAALMVGFWVFLVPLCITIIRYGKPKPTEFGVQTKIRLTNIKWWWFNFHKYGLFLAIILSIGGALVALVVSSGFSGTVHAVFGVLTVIMGIPQVVSALLRGTHGGKCYNNADLEDSSTWRATTTTVLLVAGFSRPTTRQAATSPALVPSVPSVQG